LELLLTLDKLGGPHFRFEEESLYPALEKFYGKEYHEYLVGVHDRIIKSAKKLAEILGKGELTAQEGAKVAEIIRKDLLPHPIECEGLTLLAEKLNRDEVEKIAQNLEAARKADVPLLEWADKVRARKVLA
jgi:DNA-binding PadR family transcriptional regulator